MTNKVYGDGLEVDFPCDNPQRYVGLSGQQVKDVLKDFPPSPEWVKGFYWSNLVKYVLRFKNKGGVEDLKKAKDYLEWIIEEEGSEND